MAEHYLWLTESSRMYWGTWVVLPEPVQPVNIETWKPDLSQLSHHISAIQILILVKSFYDMSA